MATINLDRSKFGKTKNVADADILARMDQNTATAIKQDSRSMFFHAKDLQDILAQADCAAIRVYPAMNAKDEHSLLLVGVNSNGNDMVNKVDDTIAKADEKCFISEGINQAAGRFNAADAISRIRNAVRSPDSNPSPLLNDIFSSSFSKAVIPANSLLSMLSGTTKGINFYVSGVTFQNDANTYKTVGVSAVDSNDTEDDTVLLSTLPCPPNCGGTGYVDEDTLT